MTAARVVCVDVIDLHGDEGILPAARALHELGAEGRFVTSAILQRARRGPAELLPVPVAALAAQLAVAFDGSEPIVARIGIVGGRGSIEQLAEHVARARPAKVVLAPVVAYRGVELLDRDAIEAMVALLFPLCDVVVFRAGDVARWTDTELTSVGHVERAAESLLEQGARAVLVSGWVRDQRVHDLLAEHGAVRLFDTTRCTAPRQEGLSAAHGTAIAARLAGGASLAKAASAAQRYVGSRLRRGR